MKKYNIIEILCFQAFFRFFRRLFALSDSPAFCAPFRVLLAFIWLFIFVERTF